jgi:hypothetical protein
MSGRFDRASTTMALMLMKQRPAAWSFELEARPFGEIS